MSTIYIPQNTQVMQKCFVLVEEVVINILQIPVSTMKVSLDIKLKVVSIFGWLGKCSGASVFCKIHLAPGPLGFVLL